ncbi:Receptor-interacting serine/threonine-protein kinase 4 [Phytophthora citrophthora]|uniref:Receptor-interacting serine/threonine-protein kinase 4 n=1 Tax=Phytophthora citrophthora TaxID=4793 RepID=A0AAD9LFP0_9STRA|nr:Receptor-interacting serine/threonine-protein kinase 4 [Phytophthora citrophthora]
MICGMGIRSTRPVPLAHAELVLAPFFRRRFRSWHLDHVRLALQRYRLLTTRYCVDSLQLSDILGIKERKLVDEVVRLFLPRTPTRVQCMVDVMEVLIALVLVCQAPGMLHRFELIFDIVDVEAKGSISTTDLIMLCGAVGRAIMKLFEYKVEPEQNAAMTYVTEVLDTLGVGRNGSISKGALCKFMVSDHFAVHYVKQCTGEDKPKLYIMLEKDSGFLGAIEFSDEQHMRTTPLRTVRDMIYAQVQRVPDDFLFLCQGREVDKVWEVDRRAWSIVPFALRGSPGLRADILAQNRRLERPANPNPFQFRYMGNIISRYKKIIHDIKPVYKHRGFRLRKNAPQKCLDPAVEWRVATTWSGEWIYKQEIIKAKSKAGILKYLRTVRRPQQGVLTVKSHFGEILSPSFIVGSGDEICESEKLQASTFKDASNEPLTPPQSQQRMQRIISMGLRERKRDDKLRQQRLKWKARLIAMEAQHQMEERLSSTSDVRQKKNRAVDGDSTRSIHTMLVRVEEENVLPSRLIQCEPKKRQRPQKQECAAFRWKIAGRFLSALPPKRKKLKVTKISDGISLATPSGTSTNRQLDLGPFLSSTHIILEDNEVEVFPVLILRSLEEQICISKCDGDELEDCKMQDASSSDGQTLEEVVKKPLFASKSYLSQFEYEISARESNFELLYQHVASGILQDAIWLGRRDVFGRTMLHDAAQFGHTNVMELLLKARVIVDTKDSKGDTPLHYAARLGRLKEVSMLLREHAIPWLLNFEGKSPLYCALETAARGPMRPNSQTKDQAGVVDDRKNFFLTHRTYPQLRQVIDLLWDKYQLIHLSRNDNYDRTNCLELEKHVYGDLVQACHGGNLLRVQRLVDLEKRPVLRYINDQMQFLKRTVLHEATEQGHTATVDLLLKLGVDGYLRDQRLQTSLSLAAWKGYDNIVKCLIAKCPQTASYQDITGCTPLHLAVKQRHWNIAAELISLIRNSGDAIFHDAIAGCNAEGQSVNCLDLQDIHGYTALHYACIYGNFEICKALVCANATVRVSRCEYRIVKGTPHLLGIWWKGNTKRSSKSVKEISEQCKIVDIEAPIELLIQGCKQDFSNLRERIDVLNLFLNHDGVIGGDRDKSHIVKVSPSPLYHIAAQLADINISVAVEICRQLHRLHVEINMTHPQTGETVLLQECKRICTLVIDSSGSHTDESNQLALVRCLVELGANIDLANETNGESPLGCAAWYGHLSLLDLLLEAGGDKDGFLRRCSYSPLHFATLGSNVACAKLLIGRSATVNVVMPPSNAETPLFFAIRSKSQEMVDLLLRSKADPCSLCTVQQSCKTSFGISLSLPSDVNNGDKSGDGDESAGSAAIVASPLTFGLLIAQSSKAFSEPEQLSCTVNRSQKQAEWIEMEHICTIVTKRLLEDNDGSRGVVTREDVHLACTLGFWGLVQILLKQQIVLSNAPSAYGMNALHLAAAAGQTKVVTTLVAGGMNVNCVTRNDSSKPKRSTGRRSWYQWIGCGHRGALFYALIHGHSETAAKLLVLGANAEQTIPHTRKKVRWRIEKNKLTGEEFYEIIVVRFIVVAAMSNAARTRYIEKAECGGNNNSLPVDIASTNLIHLIECSINQKVLLLHLAVALGHKKLVQTLTNSGMSIFSGFAADPTARSGMAGGNALAETPIHVAIACGHLEILKYFGEVVQNHFPGCFVGEGKTFKSLLATACEARQLSILQFLVGHDGIEAGGGFTYEACRDEFQSALCTCAVLQFTQGFELLILHGARPNVQTLVHVLKGITLPSNHSMVSSHVKEVEFLERGDSNCRAPFPGERCQYDYRRNSIEEAIKLLKRVLSSEWVSDISEFFGTSPVYELVLKIFVVCSRYGLWFVLDRIFVCNQEYFLDVASIWKPVLVRAACNSLVLHRAAMNNQASFVQVLLRLGVSATLQFTQAPSIRRPVWYAATRGSLEAFLCLALQSTSFIEDLEFCQVLNSLPLAFRSIEESRSTLSTTKTTCRWQNLSVFGCIDVPKKHTNGFLIQKFINYGLLISRGHVDSTLLHHACRRGELIAVQALVDAGADLTATNRSRETPLEVASGRKDGFGISIVRFLLSAMKEKLTSPSDIVDRALIRCFAEPALCNSKIAQILLDAGANAKFSCGATDDEVKTCGSTNVSAIFYAMQTAQASGVQLLVDHGAIITVALSEVFLTPFVMDANHSAKYHWRRFSKFVKHKGGREMLLNVEAIMNILLQETIFTEAMNSDLVYQMISSAAAIAATIAKSVDESKRFWEIVGLVLEKYPKEARTRKSEWNHKGALHYAVACLELSTVAKLLELRGFDLLAENENKQTSLHVAAVGGDEAICRLLLTKMQSNTTKATAIDVVDVHGRTALHLAVIHGHESVANMLVAAGASLDVRCRDGLTALLYAAKCNRLAILIALYAHAQPKPTDALLTANQEAAIFVAARYGAFPVVRWFINLFEEDCRSIPDEETTGNRFIGIKCNSRRTLLHYSAIHGDEETLNLLLKEIGQDSVDVRDKYGYTALLYAFAFGKLRVVRRLCEFGADPYTRVDHSGDPSAHPYTLGYDIADLLQWFALPGWYSFSCKYLPPEEKVRLISSTSIEENYLSHSSYNYRKKQRRPPVEWRCKWERIPAARLLKSEPRRRGKELVRASVRSWRFPHKTIFDYACEIGNAQIVEFLVNLRLPQLFRGLTYQAQRRNFMQAVRWNRLEVVKTLVSSTDSGIELTTGNYFVEFLEAGIDCAVSRGLEEMAIYLVNQWKGTKDSDQATPSGFSFQFAAAFQVACIRKLPKLMERMIERGGEAIVEFHLNEGPALVYAFAFANMEIVELLLRNGADPRIPTATYSVPSVGKWVGFGSPEFVGVYWQPQGKEIQQKKPAFIGPLDIYEAPTSRLSLDQLCSLFSSINFGIATSDTLTQPESADSKEILHGLANLTLTHSTEVKSEDIEVTDKKNAAVELACSE